MIFFLNAILNIKVGIRALKVYEGKIFKNACLFNSTLIFNTLHTSNLFVFERRMSRAKRETSYMRLILKRHFINLRMLFNVYFEHFIALFYNLKRNVYF